MNEKAHGFTIIELLVVIIVIAILATVSFVTYTGIQDKTRAAVTKVDLENLADFLEIYHLQTGLIPVSAADMQLTGFSATNKLTDDTDSTPRGKYRLTSMDGNVGFLVEYFDYDTQYWTVRRIHYQSSEDEWVDETWVKPGNCRERLLENCQVID